MKLRRFEIDNDFESMKNWVTDERHDVHPSAYLKMGREVVIC